MSALSMYNVYGPFFPGGCLPTAPDLVVASVEAELCAYMATHGLGAPQEPGKTVKSVLDDLLQKQGIKIEGVGNEAFAQAVREVIAMVNDSNYVGIDAPAVIP